MHGKYFDYKLTPEEIMSKGILYVNHEKNKRSGHLSHALVQYRKDAIMSFYSNCSGTRNKWWPGHNGFGWLEYRKSFDYGNTWTEPKVFQYSWDSFLNQPFTVSCEKAVSTQDDEIIALCIRNENPNGWEPYLEPVVVKSTDGGETWSDAKVMCDKKGRIYDALVRDGKIYVLMLADDDFLAVKPEHRYYIYRSDDHGETFELHGEVPGDTYGRAYGSMIIRDDGALVVYDYNSKDEYNMDYHVSMDMGKTWCESGLSYCAKRIRNPQVGKVKGGYILHGRSGCNGKELPMNFVLYTSKDGINWDEGLFISPNDVGTAFYSNNLVMDMEDGSQRILIQSSVPYDGARVNICHWIMEIE